MSLVVDLDGTILESSSGSFGIGAIVAGVLAYLD
jgi:cysteine synthase